MDDSRSKALEAGANVKTGGTNFNYVDTTKLERMGIGYFVTGKKPGGNNFMRIVAPSVKGAFAKEIWVHTRVGASNATFLCLERMFGKLCPICEHAKKLKREGVDPKIIKELAPGHRFLLFVVDTASRETEEEGPKWFDCPPTIYKEVCILSKDRRSGEKIDPTDPENGRDVEFVRVDGNRTSYTGFKLVPTKPIPRSWYEDLPTFEDILLIPDPVEMEAAVGVRKPDPQKEDNSRGRSSDSDVRDESRGESRGSRGESKDATRETMGESRDDSRRRRLDDTGAADAVKDKLAEIRERKTREARDDD